MSVGTSNHGIGSLIVEITEELQVEETVVIENYVQQLTQEIRTLDLEDEGDLVEFSQLVQDVGEERQIGKIPKTVIDPTTRDTAVPLNISTDSLAQKSGVNSTTNTSVSTI